VPDVAISSKPTRDCVGSVLTARRFFTAFRMTVESLEWHSFAQNDNGCRVTRL
jgi:hypothetical protein